MTALPIRINGASGPKPGVTYKRTFTNGLVVPITVTSVDEHEVVYRSGGGMIGKLARKMWDAKVADDTIVPAGTGVAPSGTKKKARAVREEE